MLNTFIKYMRIDKILLLFASSKAAHDSNTNLSASPYQASYEGRYWGDAIHSIKPMHRPAFYFGLYYVSLRRFKCYSIIILVSRHWFSFAGEEDIIVSDQSAEQRHQPTPSY